MKRIVSFILLILFLGGCRTDLSVPENGTTRETGALTVSAAVSLKDAFNEIGELYKSKTGGRISFNFGSSGALQKQIENGAPVDVFASAGQRQMDELAARNLIDAGTRRDFARNKLVLIVPADSNLSPVSFSDLRKPEFRKIAVGNPKTVPAGQYTEQVLEKTDLKNAVQSRLILAEDVRQVLEYVARGETDAGIVYASDARSGAAGEKVRVVAEAGSDLHSPIFYPIAVVRDSEKKRAARSFLDLVLSAEGQAILGKYGFETVADK
jgi:molybdate transport system substrate-binding protein